MAPQSGYGVNLGAYEESGRTNLLYQTKLD